MYGRPCLSLEHHSRNRALLPVLELQKAETESLAGTGSSLQSQEVASLSAQRQMHAVPDQIFGPFPEYL